MYRKMHNKRRGVSVLLSSLYSLWHISYMMVYIYSHLLFRQIEDANPISHDMAKVIYWDRIVAYMGYFTGNVNLNGRSNKWYFFIILFIVLMIIYDARFAIVAHLVANASAIASIWIIQQVCRFLPHIKLGAGNYFLNLQTSLIYSSFALIIAIILYIPILIYKHIKHKANLQK